MSWAKVVKVNSDLIYPLNVIMASDQIMNAFDRHALTMNWKRSRDLGLVIDRMGGYGQPADLLAVKSIDDLTQTLFDKYIRNNAAILERWNYGIDMPPTLATSFTSNYWRTAMKDLISRNAGRATSYSTDTFGEFSGAGKYRSGTLAKNGKIYCTPANATSILVFDTYSHTYYTIGTGITGYGSGVLADNDKIYAISETKVLVIDTTNDKVDTFDKPAGTGAAGVLAKNGKIYFVGNSLLEVDPLTEEVYVISSTGIDGRIGGVLAPNDKIYFVPNTASSILVVDPNTRQFYPISSGSGYYAAVLAHDDKIYGVPFQNAAVLVIDPKDDTVSTFGSVTGSFRYMSGALAHDGKIVCSPGSNTQYLIIDPIARTISYGLDIGGGGDKYSSTLLAPNGNFYNIPFSASNIRVLSLGAALETPSIGICTSAWYNKR